VFDAVGVVAVVGRAGVVAGRRGYPGLAVRLRTGA
jgi:hypothetical protein